MAESEDSEARSKRGVGGPSDSLSEEDQTAPTTHSNEINEKLAKNISTKELEKSKASYDARRALGRTD